MWYLVMVLLVIPPGFSSVTVLGQHPSLALCQRERARVGFEMAAAYPHERTFVIDCVMKSIPKRRPI